MSRASRALFTTPLKQHRHEEVEESPSVENSSFSESLSHASWRTHQVRKHEPSAASAAALAEELQGSHKNILLQSGAKKNARQKFFFFLLSSETLSSACYKLLKEERRINNDFHKRVHGSPSEWGKMVSKRMMELHPLYSPSKAFVGDKRARPETDDVVAVELDDVESMIREEVLQQLQVRAKTKTLHF